MSDVCIACGHVFLEADETRHSLERQTCRQTHDSPAEWELVGPICRGCYLDADRDEDYERAAARYDGEGKDWR